MIEPVKVGLIGNGQQMRNFHLPYLSRRSKEKKDVKIAWAGGCLCTEAEQQVCPMREFQRGKKCEPGRSTDWHRLLDEEPVDGVVISTPNSLHRDAIDEAIKRDVSVAVDKPTTTNADSAAELVARASERELVFVTLSQRRYEALYETVDQLMRTGKVGNVRLISHLIVHGFFDAQREMFRANKELSGGGALLDSGHHGIDAILWMLSRMEPLVQPVSVSARLDYLDDDPNAIEHSASARIQLDNGGFFNVNASYLAPHNSVDESFMIYGDGGTVRIMRHLHNRVDQRAASLSYQDGNGHVVNFDTSSWSGKRWAPIEDFIDAVINRRIGKVWNVKSPAADSIRVLRVIDGAYESARQGGREIFVSPSKYQHTSGVDHVAVQTSNFEKAINFYVGVLGAELVEKKKFKIRQLAWLRVGNIKLELYSNREGEKLKEWSDYYSGPVHIAFTVPDVEKFLVSALNAGAEFHPSHPAPFVPIPNARKIAYLLGPDGEEIEIRDV